MQCNSVIKNSLNFVQIGKSKKFKTQSAYSDVQQQ